MRNECRALYRAVYACVASYIFMVTCTTLYNARPDFNVNQTGRFNSGLRNVHLSPFLLLPSLNKFNLEQHTAICIERARVRKRLDEACRGEHFCIETTVVGNALQIKIKSNDDR